MELRFELLKRHDNGSDSNGNEDDRDHNDIVIISSAAITANRGKVMLIVLIMIMVIKIIIMTVITTAMITQILITFLIVEMITAETMLMKIMKTISMIISKVNL